MVRRRLFMNFKEQNNGPYKMGMLVTANKKVHPEMYFGN